ncbi:MAG TPA: T9SS type A sorting domain-containing protein [Candidatus Udaeobacter sp.]|jgi:hypothetical protein|nr:T9SS type A sorting domain-containing protein [Candidatus Udaeobacter sp.]
MAISITGNRSISLALLAIVSLAHPARAAWPHDPANGNLPLCTASSDQLYPTIVPDGAGGAIVTWEDQRSGNFDIYAQRVNAAGVPQWTPNGVALCTAATDQVNPIIASDGAGGAIVTWADHRNGTTDIFAQRVNAAGVPQWTANGVAVCMVTLETNPNITPDGAGGAFITWQDDRTETSYDIYAQRLNAAGVPQWTANGVALCVQAGDQFSPTPISDGAGGAIVIWQDNRVSSTHVYAQRVNGAGVAQWTANGVALCPGTPDPQVTPAIVTDGAGGAIISWADERGVGWDIYAQRVNAAGALQWSTTAAQITNQGYDENAPTMISDGTGGAIVTWQDQRSSAWDIYAQRVNSSGVSQWTAQGVALCLAAGDQHIPTIAPDGAGGAIVSWQDYRSGISADIYAQRVSAAGTPQWTANGVPLSTVANPQQSPVIASDGSGGAIATWYDYRGGATADIYAQRIERFGYLGNPEPSIVNVRDVLDDQGGKVSLEWYASYLDADPGYQIGSYWIWRQAPRAAALAALEHGARLESEGATPESSPRGLYRITRYAAQDYFWEYVSSQPAQGFSGYSMVVATTGDSTGSMNPRTYFMVEAKAASSSAFWNSAPDSGYSVDNLPPVVPAPFTGAYVAGATHLHWGRNHETDLVGYRLYRGSSSGFVPGPGNLISAQPDTGYSDAGPEGSWYKLSAIDIHDNESAYALLGPNSTLDAPEGGPVSFALEGARPNPSSGERLEVAFGLPSAEPGRLELIDVTGRRVREAEIGPLGAGRHTVDLTAGRPLAPGLYLVRLTQGRQVRATRVAVVR